MIVRPLTGKALYEVVVDLAHLRGGVGVVAQGAVVGEEQDAEGLDVERAHRVAQALVEGHPLAVDVDQQVALDRRRHAVAHARHGLRVDARGRAVGHEHEQVPGDDVVLRRGPGRAGAAGQQAAGHLAVEQPVRGAAREGRVAVRAVGGAVHRRGDAGPGDRAGVEHLQARAVADVEGVVDRAVGALEGRELVEQLLGLCLLAGVDQGDRGDGGVIGPGEVGDARRGGVLFRDVERAHEAQALGRAAGEEVQQRAGGGRPRPELLALLDRGRADLLGQELGELLVRAVAARLLGGPRLADMAALARSEPVLLRGGGGGAVPRVGL